MQVLNVPVANHNSLIYRRRKKGTGLANEFAVDKRKKNERLCQIHRVNLNSLYDLILPFV